MNMSNTLISSDNLGYSALRMEQELNPGSSPGKVIDLYIVAKTIDLVHWYNIGDSLISNWLHIPEYIIRTKWTESDFI